MQNHVGLALSLCSSVDPGTRHRIILTWRAQPACLWPMLRQRQFCHCPAAPVRTQLLARPVPGQAVLGILLAFSCSHVWCCSHVLTVRHLFSHSLPRLS